jgi:hypothetical protein
VSFLGAAGDGALGHGALAESKARSVRTFT